MSEIDQQIADTCVTYLEKHGYRVISPEEGALKITTARLQRLDENEALCGTISWDLCLSAIPHNRLESSGITKIYQLVEKSSEYISNINGIGKKSFEEIESALSHINLKLGGLPDWFVPRVETKKKVLPKFQDDMLICPHCSENVDLNREIKCQTMFGDGYICYYCNRKFYAEPKD